MRSRRAAATTYTILGVTLGCIIGGLTFSYLNHEAEAESWAGFLAPALFFAVIGALIATRRPDNRMGWILSGIGLLWAGEWVAEQYAVHGYVTRPGGLPGRVVAAWGSEWLWIPFLAMVFVFMPLLFPTGHLPSNRWKPLGLVAVATTGTFTFMAMKTS